MSDRTAIKSQCDKVAEELDKLSDGEMMFYLYCLLPRFADKLEAEIKEMKAETFYDAMEHEFGMIFVDNLRHVQDLLAYYMF